MTQQKVKPQTFLPEVTNHKVTETTVQLLSNINFKIVFSFREALFRQLCALYWLLEAMNVENANTMAPISTCWSRRYGIRNKHM